MKTCAFYKERRHGLKPRPSIKGNTSAALNQLYYPNSVKTFRSIAVCGATTEEGHTVLLTPILKRRSNDANILVVIA